ncbi:MAG TPA: class I SAM-dependent methyltransferase [Candidatus Saccharimonadales bacterium]|jgi:ubiquinone/menaquinone biosynthesis C-methylase UbiE|nr:class I SAM-dependent methyltransferase [Candidatus Saccharimonadales bacterium]
MPKNKPINTSEKYNDPNFDYTKYWVGREYENAAEEIAIRRLLKNKHFKNAVDIGGGYGRLCPLLEEYADSVTLAEPSSKQLTIAKNFLKKSKKIKFIKLDATNYNIPDNSVDLITMVRVMHHIPDPDNEFSQLERILSDNGYLILEVANYAHFVNKIKFLLRIKKSSNQPVDIRSRKNRNTETIPFVNHNPKTVIRVLAHNGLKVEKILSVSNLRSTTLKKLIPISGLLSLERISQPILSKSFFGPSIFFLVKKAK